MAFICGNERVERIEDFSKATKQHIVDRLSKALSEALSDQYDCNIRIKLSVREPKEVSSSEETQELS